MKVLLVNTNRMKPAIAPIGLDYLADSLEAVGHETRLLDLCFAEDISAEIKWTISDFCPEIIGVSIRNTDDCYFSGQAFFLPEIANLLSMLREISDTPIVLGGVGFSVAPVPVLEFCGAEFGIAGEGELGFLELLKAFQTGSDYSRVPNLVYRNGEGIRQNGSVPMDLTKLPPRRRALADNPRYFRKGGQAGFETKRGCAMHCSYCADPVSKGRTVRLLPPAAVVTELSNLLQQGIDHFHTCDCEFNLPGEHARDVCRNIISAGLGDKIRWYAYCAPTPFDDDMAGLFKRAGCTGIDFGVDSASDEMLRRLGRHFNSQDLANTAAICHRHKIPFIYDLLLGGPGETHQSIRHTIEFMRKIDADCVGLSIGMRVYAGTQIAEQVVAEGELEKNPNVYGTKCRNMQLLKPVYYIAPEGAGLAKFIHQLIAGDPRFFLPEEAGENSNYNYNDNSSLVQAIENGARGAYWDILRRMRLSH